MKLLRPARAERGSVLIIVLWVAFGLVTLALYFANGMGLELRAADHRVAGLQAEQAIQGAVRYASQVITNVEPRETLPDVETYQRADAPVGEAAFWFIGRGDTQFHAEQVTFGLVDEASKLNLNTVTRAMLEELPRMTSELAAAIVDWRDANSEATEGGAEDDVYQRLNPPYRCKNGPFDSVEELRLVRGMTTEILYGEDANRNGALDPHENDGDYSPPFDDRNARLDPGLVEYLTVWSREAGTGRTNINNQQQLAPLLLERFGADRANEILARFGVSANTNQPGGNFRQVGSLIEFYVTGQFTQAEFEQLYPDITTTNATVSGLVNINTASEAVLACLPGIGTDRASTVVSYRQGNISQLRTVAWLVDAIGNEAAVQAGPYVTARATVFSADVAALGHHDRGYRRVWHILDNSTGTPRVAYRRDLTHLGWALGRELREDLELNREERAQDSQRGPSFSRTR
jgi:type II secretory pathway component PulK